MVLKHPSNPVMARTYIDIDRCDLIPLCLSTLCACRTHRPSSSSLPNTLVLTRPVSFNLGLKLLIDKRSRKVVRGIPVNQHRPEPDPVDERVTVEEVDKVTNFQVKEDSASQRQQKAGVGRVWPLLLGGQTQWTVGLVATLISISSIIAADTCAFVGGKAFGQTPLTAISPKKTWEGVAAGLGGCIATSVLLSRILSWPPSFLSAIAFGILNFFGSLFGDLTESMIKRDAGVKDSGSLIPGHGGILDRTDSYIFTGALAYSFVKMLLPLYGV